MYFVFEEAKKRKNLENEIFFLQCWTENPSDLRSGVMVRATSGMRSG
jgi:hypothetical protein